ncbi:hypothetical protein, partial [Acinetobacter baumannii]|uniref:hypothetical protein n=1 Tax=Acinetobacter baumannii TaxID=470 RepID=UPI001BB46E64
MKATPDAYEQSIVTELPASMGKLAQLAAQVLCRATGDWPLLRQTNDGLQVPDSSRLATGPTIFLTEARAM